MATITIEIGDRPINNFNLAEAVHFICASYEELDASVVASMLSDQYYSDMRKQRNGERCRDCE